MTGVTLLPRVLEKIFAALVTPINIPSQAIAIKNLRRHSASLMVKLGIKYPLLLLPVFDQINSSVKALLRQPNQLRKMEKVMLEEAMLVISNHFCDYERQTNFVAEILQESQIKWNSVASVIKTGCDFVRFAGLDKEPMMEDPFMEARQDLMHAVNSVLGVIRRCSWPDDPDRVSSYAGFYFQNMYVSQLLAFQASRGGFVVGLTESGNPICRNPATAHVVPLLPHILSLLRVLNECFTAEALAVLSNGYKKVHEMVDHEKKALMGVTLMLVDPMDPELKKASTPLEKMQNQLTTLYESCYHMMGSSGPSLGRDLYQLPGIANALIGSVFSCLDNIPDYRLRPIIRVFLKPFVYSCPPAFYVDVLLPIFAHLAPFSEF